MAKPLPARPQCAECRYGAGVNLSGLFISEPFWPLDFICNDCDCSCFWYPYGDGHWRGRHASSGIDAEQLFGWAAAATGFLLGNDLLIVTGALVGASGAILSYIMCKAMNRNFISVIFGVGGSTGPQMEVEGEMVATEVTSVVNDLNESSSVIIVPGYGMAVAQAQAAVSELTRRLRAKGKNVRFAIHPVAGRLPGHMNVLLAEAKVPYDIVLEMDEINEDFSDTDMVIILGANDIVNPAAQKIRTVQLQACRYWKCGNPRQVIISKRGQGRGYSGIENPLFYKDNSRMLYGDAKASLDEILSQIGG